MADLHVYLVPPEIWREKYHNALNQNINETVSIGFIRVHPGTKIYALRDEIEQQLGTELVPREYVFVKSVGRSLTRVKARQEATLKVKNFLPPQAYAPELYLLEATPEVGQQIAASSKNSTRPETRTSYYYDFMNRQKVVAKVNIVDVVVLDNPSPFLNLFQFEITFEALEDLSEELEWKIIYVGAAESEEFDQTLETILVGPVPGGRFKFVFQATPPDTSKIPLQDAVGATVVILTCSYRNEEFIRVGYYVNNEYDEPEMKEVPPTVPRYDKLMRNILATHPYFRRFEIDWDDNQSTPVENGENIHPANNL